jgi:hypothetical protein
MEYVEEEMCDQDGWRTEWRQRLRLAFQRAEMEIEDDSTHPDERLNALAYLAAWGVIGAHAEEERRKRDYVARGMGMTEMLKRRPSI